jgi:hypothetical protein
MAVPCISLQASLIFVEALFVMKPMFAAFFWNQFRGSEYKMSPGNKFKVFATIFVTFHLSLTSATTC